MRPKTPPPFDEVRMLAWDSLQQVERSQVFADLLLDRVFPQHPHLRVLDRAFITELILGTLRWRSRLDFAIRRAAKFPGKKIDPKLLNLLRLGAYQILFMDRVPPFAAVNEAVRLAKASFKGEKISGFTNAVLRSVARNKNQEDFPPFEEQPVEYIVQVLSHPRWLAERWVREFGPDMARKICESNNLRPPFTVRVNTLKTSREALQEDLARAGIQALPAPYSPEALILKEGLWLSEEPLFQAGLYFVQDEASQIVAHLVDPRPGERVLDACAAPGGKATHMAQLMNDQGEIIGLDLNGQKIERIRENCRRLGIRIVTALRADASRPLALPQESAFDRILLDAPCTGLGNLHRHPEAKWRQKPEDIERLRRIQVALLENLRVHLKPGGVLVYSTCTVTHEENDSVVEAFLREHKDFQLDDLRPIVPRFFHPLLDEKGFLRTYPDLTITSDHYRLDGFFAARMRKKET